MPWFLFMVGMSITISFEKPLQQGRRSEVVRKAVFFGSDSPSGRLPPALQLWLQHCCGKGVRHSAADRVGIPGCGCHGAVLAAKQSKDHELLSSARGASVIP